MSDSWKRKACDRCHAHKLSCKRIGDGICERCMRMNAECKSSPSLRYRKQLQQHGRLPENTQQQPQQKQESRDLLQQWQQHPPLRIDYSQSQGAVPQTPSHFLSQHDQALKIEDAGETHTRKRRRMESELPPVQRDAEAFPILGIDATGNPAAHDFIEESYLTIGQEQFSVNLRNMDFLDLPQPSLLEYPLLPPQLPQRTENCYPFPPATPTPWDIQSHGGPQQPQPHPQQQHHHHHHHFPHHTHQIPRPVSLSLPAAPYPISPHNSILTPEYQQQRTTSILSGRRRLRIPLPSNQQQFATQILSGSRQLALPPPPSQKTVQKRPKRRSRSNHTSFSPRNSASSPEEDSSTLLNLEIMAQFFQIEARLRELSASLLRLERGHGYGTGANDKDNEFTVAELYRHTHHIADTLERAAAARRGSNSTTVAMQLAEPPLDPADPAESMFTLSLYVRLLDMFRRLFNLVSSLLAQADPKKDDTFPPCLLPEMNIGAASIDAHPAFHMSLTVQLALQFLNRLREATTALALARLESANGHGANGSGMSDSSTSSFTEVVNVSFNAIRSKEEALNKRLGELKIEIDDFMDTMDAIDALESEGSSEE